jgi:hypothetical protein
MTVQELKITVEDYHQALKTKSGSLVRFSETGPVGISLIDALISGNGISG